MESQHTQLGDLKKLISMMSVGEDKNKQNTDFVTRLKKIAAMLQADIRDKSEPNPRHVDLFMRIATMLCDDHMNNDERAVSLENMLLGMADAFQDELVNKKNHEEMIRNELRPMIKSLLYERDVLEECYEICSQTTKGPILYCPGESVHYENPTENLYRILEKDICYLVTSMRCYLTR